MTSEPTSHEGDIAVIGLAGRFPGAASVSDFWANLANGVESITTLEGHELLAAQLPQSVLDDPAYVRRAALLSGIDEFDAAFFDFTAAAARTTDPQQRLFLQTAWLAFEDAGYAPRTLDGPVGVFAATGASGYLINNVLPYYDVSTTFAHGANMAMVTLAFGNDKDYIATRVSHSLDLTGPSVAVQCACSSSLVAVHMACQSLLLGECDMALAGGVSVRVPHQIGYLYEPGSIVSPDGHCRAFDAAADGTVFGSGVGAVLLKPLAAAIADGDAVRAVIRGSAVNNDGSKKMGFAAPSVTMQARVVAEAMAVAGVTSDEVGYIETHGTGTPLGDPVEVRALALAFADRTADRQCILGSVKANIGHLEAASGIAGLIKTVLALEHRTLPGTLHYTRPNPELGLEHTPFTIHPGSTAWEGDGPRIAGVSSLGVGGTNVHVIVSEAPRRQTPVVQPGPHALQLSARTPEALDRMRTGLELWLRQHGDNLDLGAAAHTLAAGRTPMPHRLAAVGRDAESLADVLQDRGSPGCQVSEAVQGGQDRVAFLFPGQGAQYASMTAGLYRQVPTFRRDVDDLCEGFSDHLGLDLRDALLGRDEALLRRTDIAQPVLFTVCTALANLLGEFGVRPDVLAGHSIGEYVAATLSGVLTLDDAIALVSRRGQLMERTEPGAMLWVRMPAADLAPLITGTRLGIAAVNDPSATVVSGTAAEIEILEERVRRSGLSARRLITQHGFHSVLMDPVLREFEEAVSGVAMSAPATPLTSNTTGAWMSGAEACDRHRWVDQMRRTVRFADNVGVLLSEPARVLIEVGPGRTLTAAARRHPSWQPSHRAVQLVRHPNESSDDLDRFLSGIGSCWTAGLDVDWSPRQSGRPRRISLPGYSFEPTRHWLEQRPLTMAPGAVHTLASSTDPGHGTPVPGTDDDFESVTEQVLARLCGELLGVEGVTRNDNFFDLGGDSVVAVQLAAGAAREGLRLTPRDIFEHQSIAALAEFVGGSADGSVQAVQPLSIVNADHPSAPVTPGQWRLIHEGLDPLEAWRVPFLLRLDPSVGAAWAVAALRSVISRHEALRLRLTGVADQAEQLVQDPGAELEVPDLSLGPDLTIDDVLARVAAGTHTGLAPDGDLDTLSQAVRAAYVKDDASGRTWLALSLHHLAVDNASYEILLADLDLALRQVTAGQQIQLPPVPVTWRAWTAVLASLATHPEILAERSHWLAPEPADVVRLSPPRSHRPSPGTYRPVRSALSVAQTDDLLRLQADRKVSLEDLLLDALSHVVTSATGGHRVVVDVEGTARNVRLEGIDLSRTIGWLTAVYPVILEPGRPPELVPRDGIGHDLLRYLHAPTASAMRSRQRPEILLAWLGTLPESSPELTGLVAPDFEVVLPAALTPPGLGHTLELRCYLHRAQLHLDWWVDTTLVAEDRAAAFCDDMVAAILATTGRRPLVQLDDDATQALLAELSAAERHG